LPSLARLSVIRTWTGFRAATADRLPLIGACPGRDRVYLATGHEGLGITTSLGTARLVADLIAGRQPAIDPAPYQPRSSRYRSE
jgi:glycine/D-amino acid oxidase-like deaminating enzyme